MQGRIKLGVPGVTQISNLLKRGFPIRGSLKSSEPVDWRRSAEWNSATQQIGNLRYAALWFGA